MFQKMTLTATLVVLFFFSTGATFASRIVNTGNHFHYGDSYSNEESDRELVAAFQGGTHTVINPDGSISYGLVGSDYVYRVGDDFEQYFEQYFTGRNGLRVYTRYIDVGSAQSCRGKGLLLVNPYSPATGQTWGSYFTPGDNYCAYSHYF